MASDPIGAGYYQDVAGIPSAYTNLLQQLGFQSQPFANVDQAFGGQESFLRSLKSILDRQGGAYGQQFTNNPGQGFTYMPQNLRNIFTAGGAAMMDPLYGIVGTPGMMSGGYKMGELPGGHSHMYQALLDQRNAPQVPPPNVNNNAAAASMSSGGGGGGGNQGGTSLFNVPIMGPNGSGAGTIQVVAHDAAGAYENAHQGGNTPTGPAVSAQGGQSAYVPPPAPVSTNVRRDQGNTSNRMF